MVSSTIDHMVAVTVFLAATLLFIGLFNQTISTAVTYQRHRAIATKASDLLDGILLSPGIPINWGQTDVIPTGFGVQDPEFTQYQISPYSLMRLRSFVGTPVNYNGTLYSNVTMGERNFMLVPYNLALNYSTATKMLGINNTYGFQLTLTPIVTVSIKETHSSNPLTLSIKADGIGFPLSYATISYCFLKVDSSGGQSSPSYEISFNTTTADSTGSVNINIPNVNADDSYALVVYARESGLVGVGYYERTFDNGRYVIPFIDSFNDGRVLLAHSYNVHDYGPPSSAVFYNATYVVMTEDFTLREMPISNGTGKVVYGQGTEQQYDIVTIPTHNPGIIVVTYNSNNGIGVVLMPWGISSLAFPMTFGGDASQQEWVATDMRQVTVGGIAYQAQIAVWSLEGYQVNG
jgi:hypothetical protein